MSSRIVRRRLRRDESGMTLVELLVSMSVFTLCMTVVFGAVILVVRKSTDVQKSADVTSALRLAMSQIDRQVRSGNVLFSPAGETTAGCVTSGVNSGTCMRVFTQSNGTEKCVQWQIIIDPASPTTKLLRTRSWATDWATSGDLTGWSTVARGLTLEPGIDPFTLQGASTPYKERLLDVRLVAFDPRRNANTVEESSMSGRNTSYGYTSAQCSLIPTA